MDNTLVELIKIEEKLKVNLSSKQIVTILNKLLNTACRPVFEQCGYFRELVLQAVLQTQDDHRRRISIHEKETSVHYIVNAVSMNCYDFIIECEPDRSILFRSLKLTMELMQKAVVLEEKILMGEDTLQSIKQMEMIARKLGMPTDDISPLAKWANVFYDNYSYFKQMIVSKYIRYAYKEAKAAMSITGLMIDFKDLVENYLLAVSKAIDKCDANKGTLTSYIGQWMLSARSNPEFDHQYCISHSIPSAVRKEREQAGIPLTNMSQQLKLDTKEEDVDYLNTLDRAFGKNEGLLRCFRELENAKVLFMVLGIAPPLTDEEKAKLGYCAQLEAKVRR